MRSGATMKVSLTPDRLKSMEVRDRAPLGGIPANPAPHPARLIGIQAGEDRAREPEGGAGSRKGFEWWRDGRGT